MYIGPASARHVVLRSVAMIFKGMTGAAAVICSVLVVVVLSFVTMHETSLSAELQIQVNDCNQVGTAGMSASNKNNLVLKNVHLTTNSKIRMRTRDSGQPCLTKASDCEGIIEFDYDAHKPRDYFFTRFIDSIYVPYLSGHEARLTGGFAHSDQSYNTYKNLTTCIGTSPQSFMNVRRVQGGNAVTTAAPATTTMTTTTVNFALEMLLTGDPAFGAQGFNADGALEQAITEMMIEVITGETGADNEGIIETITFAAPDTTPGRRRRQVIEQPSVKVTVDFNNAVMQSNPNYGLHVNAYLEAHCPDDVCNINIGTTGYTIISATYSIPYHHDPGSGGSGTGASRRVRAVEPSRIARQAIIPGETEDVFTDATHTFVSGTDSCVTTCEYLYNAVWNGVESQVPKDSDSAFLDAMTWAYPMMGLLTLLAMCAYVRMAVAGTQPTALLALLVLCLTAMLSLVIAQQSILDKYMKEMTDTDDRRAFGVFIALSLTTGVAIVLTMLTDMTSYKALQTEIMANFL